MSFYETVWKGLINGWMEAAGRRLLYLLRNIFGERSVLDNDHILFYLHSIPPVWDQTIRHVSGGRELVFCHTTQSEKCSSSRLFLPQFHFNQQKLWFSAVIKVTSRVDQTTTNSDRNKRADGDPRWDITTHGETQEDVGRGQAEVARLSR